MLSSGSDLVSRRTEGMDRGRALGVIRRAYANPIMAVMATEGARYLHWEMSNGR